MRESIASNRVRRLKTETMLHKHFELMQGRGQRILGHEQVGKRLGGNDDDLR